MGSLDKIQYGQCQEDGKIVFEYDDYVLLNDGRILRKSKNGVLVAVLHNDKIAKEIIRLGSVSDDTLPRGIDFKDDFER